jgi:hypothetical protein
VNLHDPLVFTSRAGYPYRLWFTENASEFASVAAEGEVNKIAGQQKGGKVQPRSVRVSVRVGEITYAGNFFRFLPGPASAPSITGFSWSTLFVREPSAEVEAIGGSFRAGEVLEAAVRLGRGGIGLRER